MGLWTALQQATAESHQRIDAISAHGLSTPEAYARYLQGMHRFMTVGVQAEPTRLDWASMCRFLEWDLASLGEHTLPAPALPRMDTLAGRLGWAFVVDGSALGARLLLRDIKALGYTNAWRTNFLTAHAASSKQWPQFVAQLAAFTDTDGFYHHACAHAIVAFQHAEAAFAAAQSESV